MRILLFPGQGAQRVGMARDVAEMFAPAAKVLTEIDTALGISLTGTMWEGPAEALVETDNTQPAILAHSAAVLSVISDRLKGTVVAAAGHSLGEYSAWMAAGSLSPTQAARLVRRRGSLMKQAGVERGGTMAAVIGLDGDQVHSICETASRSQSGVAVAANLNAPDQTVISGDVAAVELAGKGCEEAGARRVLPLKVGGAFHSPLMAPAVGGLASALKEAEFADQEFPVVANASAELVTTPDKGRQLLADQLTAPVRWVESIRLMTQKWPEAEWLEIGPGSVLGGLLRKIIPGARARQLGTADDITEWLAE